MQNALNSNIKKTTSKVIETHTRKLRDLTRLKTLPFQAEETVTNISSVKLTSEQLDVLKNGLTHLICPSYINRSDVYTCFELIHRSVLSNIIDKGRTGRIKATLSQLTHSYIASHRPSQSDRKEWKILKSLRRNKNIVILKPDKGNGVVVLDRTTYEDSIINLISDSSKFSKLNCDPTLSREGKLQRFLRRLKKNGEIDDTTYQDICPTGSQPARIYGLPKMHKAHEPSSAPPFCPIVSSIGTYNYNLAKFLCTLLDCHIPSDFCARDSFSFVNEITNLHTSDKFMVSFDVESLFTNIPLLESIELAVDYILTENPNIKLSKDNLKELFLIATAQTHFLFQGNYYDQIDGVAMGSPLAPVLANLFMGHHERIWLRQYDGPAIYFYRRYVDDTFCLFNNEKDASEFLCS